MKVEVAVLGSQSLISSPYGHCECKATLSRLRGCVKVEVAVLCSPSLIIIILMVSVDVVKPQH